MLYLSLDPSLDEGDYLMRHVVNGTEIVAAHNRNGVLAAGDSYTATVTVVLPFEISGDYYIIAATDTDLTDSWNAKSTISPRFQGVRGTSAGQVREFQGEGNNTTAQAVTISAHSAPNLQVTQLEASARAVRGQTFDVSWTVTNSGGEVPFQPVLVHVIPHRHIPARPAVPPAVAPALR